MALNKFVFCAIPLPVASANPGKASNRKRPSHFMRSSLQLGPSCVFRRTAQPSVMCGALSRMRQRSRIAESARSVGARRWPLRANRESSCCAGRVEETILRLVLTITFKFDGNCFLLVAAASALLTKCNSLPMPRFRQTCGRKCSTPCGGRSAKRGLLNNSQ